MQTIRDYIDDRIVEIDSIEKFNFYESVNLESFDEIESLDDVVVFDSWLELEDYMADMFRMIFDVNDDAVMYYVDIDSFIWDSLLDGSITIYHIDDRMIYVLVEH